MARLREAVCMLAIGLGAAGALQAQQGSDLSGFWTGTLDVQGTQLRLSFDVTNTESGLQTVLTSIDQGNAEIPVATTTLEDGVVTFDIPAIAGTYHGELSQDGQRMEGTWSQGGASFPLVLIRSEEGPEPPARPQHPTEPLPYHVEEISFENPAGSHSLAGTFTRPDAAGTFPAVVLISGSGPQDRDETLVGHKPFLVVSDHLTRQGIAVLRFDDRGVAGSTGDFESATSEDFATDVEAALRYLGTRGDVVADQIGLVGHSEGGLIAPIVAARNAEVAFIVMLAGPGVSGAEILRAQQAAISRANGADDETVERNAEIQNEIYAALELYDAESAPDHIEPLVRKSLEGTINDEASLAQVVPATTRQLNSPWFRFFIRYDPATTLERVRVPVLAIGGEKDLQVLPEQNMPALAKAFEASGNPDVTLRVLPGLNHLFQHAETGSPSEYQRIEETFAPEALELVSRWILERTRGVA